MKGIVETAIELPLYDQMELAKSFCYLGDRLNARGGSEVAMTARTKLGWVKFREYGELLNGRMLSLKTKGQIYRS